MQIIPPPTHESPINKDPATGIISFNPQWLKWFLDLAAFVSASGGMSGAAADHNMLTSLQGGGNGERYHLTALELADLIVGFTGIGNIVRQGSPALTTPSIGAATGISLYVTGTLTGGAIVSGSSINGGNITGSGAVQGATVVSSGALTGGEAAALVHASTTLTNGAAAAAGTLLNAPAAGNPTKWIPIDDAGVTRYVPAW